MTSASLEARAACVLASLAIASLARAHHSVLPFNATRGTTVSGIVTEVRWQNPHVYILLDAQRADGATERWSIESESPGALERLGWSAESIETGDRITALGAAARDGSRSLRCKHVELAGGRTLPCFAAVVP